MLAFLLIVGVSYYLVSVVPVLGVDQVHVAQHDGQHIPDHIELDMSDDYRMSRLKV